MGGNPKTGAGANHAMHHCFVLKCEQYECVVDLKEQDRPLLCSVLEHAVTV